MENQSHQPWNKRKLVGQTALLNLRDTRAIQDLQLRPRSLDLVLVPDVYGHARVWHSRCW